MVTCPRCGLQLPQISSYCARCGERLVNYAPASAQVIPPSPEHQVVPTHPPNYPQNLPPQYQQSHYPPQPGYPPPYPVAYALPPPKRRWWLYGLLGFIVVVILIVVAAGGLFVGAVGDEAKKQIDSLKAMSAVLGKENAAQETFSGQMSKLKSQNSSDTISVIKQLGDAYGQYARDEKAIDTSQCPADFASAYARLTAATSNLANTTSNVPDIPVEELKAAIAGLGASSEDSGTTLAEAQGEINGKYESWKNQITDNQKEYDQALDNLNAVYKNYRQSAAQTGK